MSAAEELRTRLLTLSDHFPVSATRQIERLLPEIETALKHGVSRETVRLALWDAGIEVQPTGFASALQRLRRKARGVAKVEISAPPTENEVVAQASLTTLRDIARSTPDLQKWADLAKKGEQR